MPTGPSLLAYFGPEIQLPLISLIGAISGMILIVGRAPIRWIRRWSSVLRRKKGIVLERPAVPTRESTDTISGGETS